MTFIGTGSRENNMELADMDGDGKMDLVTNSAIFFQNNPHSWTTVTLNSSFKGLALLDIGSGQGSINVVGLGGTGPYSFVRQEGNSLAHLYSMIATALCCAWINSARGIGNKSAGSGYRFQGAQL